jgi:hypothetical protein
MFILFLPKISIIMAQKENTSVSLTQEIRLEQALIEAKIKKPSSVKKLTIMGLITIEDFHYIQTKMRRTLRELDMHEASLENNIIPNWAFNHFTALKTVKIPNTVNKIGKCAFWRCDKLCAVKIPDAVSEVEVDAFNYEGIATVMTTFDNPNYDNTEAKSAIFCKPNMQTMLTQYLPENALNEVMYLLQEHTIHLRVTLPRRSVLGTYIRPTQRNYHIITINGDLNRYEFLEVFLHEYAHLLAFVNGVGYPPHGIGWKNTFRDLLHYFIRRKLFPDDICLALKDLMVKMPAASTTNLASVLSNYGAKGDVYEKSEYCCG